MKRLLLIFLLCVTLSAARAENWAQQVIHSGFHINDPSIRYPKFPKFCLNVYNWGDQTFNTYDTNYVTGTGCNWKASVEASSWMENYGYLFDMSTNQGWKERVTMRSHLNYDMGVHLSFMAVTVGYTWNVNKLAHVNHAPRSAFDFNFSCALFTAELRAQHTEGNTSVSHFGEYNEGRHVNIPLRDVANDLFYIRAYYFFNHKHFSEAAVYKFSKYQKRSAGSWLLGVSYTRQKIAIDFSSLPEDVLEFRPESLPMHSNFNFHDFDILGGYSYNLVMPHNWVANFTFYPAMGYKRSLLTGDGNNEEMISLNLNGRLGITYNHRSIFTSFQARARGGFVFNSGYSFFNATSRADIIFGVRF